VIGAEFPDVRYADADGVAIAYEVRGGGAIDLLVVPGVYTGLVTSVLGPASVEFYDRLGAFARLIRFDKRGTGMSDPFLSGATPPLEQQVADVVAVMDTVGSERAALYGQGGPGCMVAVLCAAIHPERVSALVLQGAVARYLSADDYPIGMPVDAREDFLEQVRRRWGDLDDPWMLGLFPSRASDPSFVRRLARLQQLSASKHAAVETHRLVTESDVRAVLPLVQATTLFVSQSGLPERPSGVSPRDAGLYMAQHIPDAHLIELRGPEPLIVGLVDEADKILAPIQEFLTGVGPPPPTSRVLATVLFTDIVASTERVAEGGDRHWRHQLDQHDHSVRAQLARFRGREINTMGDGFFATFEGPARAIHCARAIIDGARALGIGVRAGVHVGECEVRGDDLAGIAVHIGSRVSALAAPGEVLVSRTVVDLVAGSGIEFEDRGEHALKGVPGTWRLYRAMS
jgi:class 3 adenylate cyclase/pimeloyl-ACP methyl ester carboxylesterase